MHVPSTNNSFEATNRVIKDEDTLRERIVLSRFTVILFWIVKRWSKERDPASVNSKKFEHLSLIKLSNWIDGYNWTNLSKDVISVLDVDKTIYYLPANETTTITNE